jgi:hypothetical protein
MIPQQLVRSVFEAVMAAATVATAANHGEKDDDDDDCSEPEKDAKVETADR